MADSMNILGTINAGTNTVILEPKTAGTAIRLGSPKVDGSLCLSDAELDKITAGRLIIGSATAGAITIAADIDFTDGPVVPTVHLITNSSVTGTAGGILATDLAITANGTINITDTSTNITRLAVSEGASAGNITFVEANGFTVASVDSVVGVTTVGNITLTATTGALTIGDGSGQDITAGTGNVQLSAGAGITEGTGSIVTAAGLALLGSGTDVLTEHNDVATFAANVNGSVTYYDSNKFTVGIVNSTTGITLGATAGDNLSLTAGGVGIDPAANITLSANVSTTGTQTYNSTILLGADVTLASSGAGAAGNITFAKSVNDDGNSLTSSKLTVNTLGTTLFSAGVGDIAPFTSLTTDAGGQTNLTLGMVTTTGNQTYGDLVLTTDTMLVSSGNGNITLQNAVSGAFNLVVNTGGTTTLPTINNLTSVTTDSGGTTILTGNVTTTGAQSYNDNVKLGGSVILASSGNADIVFGGTINDDGIAGTTSNLTINTGGTVTITGAVGTSAAITSIVSDAPGTLILSDGHVTTTGDQSLNDFSTLQADSTFTSTGGGAVAFHRTPGPGHAHGCSSDRSSRDPPSVFSLFPAAGAAGAAWAAWVVARDRRSSIACQTRTSFWSTPVQGLGRILRQPARVVELALVDDRGGGHLGLRGALPCTGSARRGLFAALSTFSGMKSPGASDARAESRTPALSDYSTDHTRICRTLPGTIRRGSVTF